MRGFEIRHEIGDQIIVAVAILLEQQMTVIIDIARIILKPSFQRSVRRWAIVQGQCRNSPAPSVWKSGTSMKH
ncbi:hypothetical protein BF95_12240 [Sphingobium sp. Ant17]|nr:hypothetical protein BF95_12240 [Sphingobium sp. Ant17]